MRGGPNREGTIHYQKNPKGKEKTRIQYKKETAEKKKQELREQSVLEKEVQKKKGKDRDHTAVLGCRRPGKRLYPSDPFRLKRENQQLRERTVGRIV